MRPPWRRTPVDVEVMPTMLDRQPGDGYRDGITCGNRGCRAVVTLGASRCPLCGGVVTHAAAVLVAQRTADPTAVCCPPFGDARP